LHGQVQDLQNQVAQERARVESLAALVSAQDAAHETIARLQAENERLGQALESAALRRPLPSEDVQVLQGELRLALEEVARLRGELRAAEERAADRGSAPAGPAGERGAVLASIAEELRQPLASIQGYSDLLLGESVGGLGALQRKFLERVKAATERAGGLLEALIRAASGPGRPVSGGQAVALAAVAQAAAAEVGELLGAKNIRLAVDMAEGLPPIAISPAALHQILIHLLQNAASATPAGGEIRLAAGVESPAAGFLRVEVSDQGGGVPREQQDLFFSPARPPGAAPGAGLPAVKTLVEAAGGRVWLDSHPGRGSTVHLLLPVSPGAPPGPAFPGPEAERAP
jgi:signal transduction histidine kinase